MMSTHDQLSMTRRLDLSEELLSQGAAGACLTIESAVVRRPVVFETPCFSQLATHPCSTQRISDVDRDSRLVIAQRIARLRKRSTAFAMRLLTHVLLDIQEAYTNLVAELNSSQCGINQAAIQDALHQVLLGVLRRVSVFFFTEGLRPCEVLLESPLALATSECANLHLSPRLRKTCRSSK